MIELLMSLAAAFASLTCLACVVFVKRRDEARVGDLKASIAFLERSLSDAGTHLCAKDAAMCAERDAWGAERAMLLTRIQAWEAPAPEEKVEKESSLPAREQEPDGVEPSLTDRELAALGLSRNSGGGYLDRNAALFESVTDYKEYLGILRKNGLPPSTKPDDLRFMKLGGT